MTLPCLVPTRTCLVKDNTRLCLRPARLGSPSRTFPSTYQALLSHHGLQLTKAPLFTEIAIVDEAQETPISPFEGCHHHMEGVGAEWSLSSQGCPPHLLTKATSPRMPRHIRDFSSPSRAKIQKLIIQSTRNNKESQPKWSTPLKNSTFTRKRFSLLVTFHMAFVKMR